MADTASFGKTPWENWSVLRSQMFHHTEATIATPKIQVPVFLRLPKPNARCPYTGMSRTTMCELTVPSDENDFTPPVKSYVKTTRADAKRGIRFIESQSLLDYIRSLSASAAN